MFSSWYLFPDFISSFIISVFFLHRLSLPEDVSLADGPAFFENHMNYYVLWSTPPLQDLEYNCHSRITTFFSQQINEAQRQKMRPNSLKGNNRLGHYKSISYGPTDWQTEGNLSKTTVIFGGRCARDRFWCYPWLLCFLDHICIRNSQFRAFLFLQKHYKSVTYGRTDG